MKRSSIWGHHFQNGCPKLTRISGAELYDFSRGFGLALKRLSLPYFTIATIAIQQRSLEFPNLSILFCARRLVRSLIRRMSQFKVSVPKSFVGTLTEVATDHHGEAHLVVVICECDSRDPSEYLTLLFLSFSFSRWIDCYPCHMTYDLSEAVLHFSDRLELLYELLDGHWD